MLEESVTFLTSWFTPTVFFFLLQLVIVTIYIISTLSNNPHKHHHEQPPPQQHDPHFQQTHNYFQQQNHQPPLARSPSLLHRLKSINFYSYTPPNNSHHETPQRTFQQTPQQTLQQTPQQIARSPSSVIQRLKSINLHTYFPTETISSYFTTDANNNASSSGTCDTKSPHVPKTPLPKTELKQQQQQQQRRSETERDSEEESDGGDDFVGEIGDSGCGSSSMDEIFRNLQQGQNGNFERTQSDTKPASGEVPVKLPKKMRKSASTKSAFSHFEEGDIVERRRPASAREGDAAAAVAEAAEGGGVGQEVDAKADDFINRFKQQLKLQRLDSFIRYKDMIGRGTGK